jgi:hypothetical protein
MANGEWLMVNAEFASSIILRAGFTAPGFLIPSKTLLHFWLGRRKCFCHGGDDPRPEDVQKLGEFLFVVRGSDGPFKRVFHLLFLSGVMPGKSDVTRVEVSSIRLLLLHNQLEPGPDQPLHNPLTPTLDRRGVLYKGQPISDPLYVLFDSKGMPREGTPRFIPWDERS